MKALLAQLASAPGGLAANAERAAAVLAEHPEADLALFPELFLSGYAVSGLDALACEADAPPIARVADAAARARTAVVLGFPERGSLGVANAAACIDADGSLVAVYRKAHLFGAERDAFVAGNELVVAELAGRRVGVLVCFDVEFPEPVRALAAAGADLLVTISANMEPFYADHELLTRARALENRLPHVYANGVGEAAGFRLVGGSRSIDENGKVVAELSHDREAVLVADVAEAAAVDERVDYVRLFRPELLAVTAERGRRPASSSQPGTTPSC